MYSSHMDSHPGIVAHSSVARNGCLFLDAPPTISMQYNIADFQTNDLLFSSSIRRMIPISIGISRTFASADFYHTFIFKNTHLRRHKILTGTHDRQTLSCNIHSNRHDQPCPHKSLMWGPRYTLRSNSPSRLREDKLIRFRQRFTSCRPYLACLIYVYLLPPLFFQTAVNVNFDDVLTHILFVNCLAVGVVS
ncbi:hypothetical protein BD410DRAFT_110956 [Rickenella mellea]|uniref:Uncharacterized protein n=1 Tax=Rickenella mellea TaxID=50990 RepID=A0A4Y7QAA4_9AGAM|nr:hypothetical protein BD410DRAFT_110956 [Rickenella mellea]